MREELVSRLDRMLLDPEYAVLINALFPAAGSSVDVAFLVETVCRTALAAPVEQCFYAEMSVGALFGLRLTGARRVALKFHLPSADHGELRATSSVQRFLHGGGFPCPPALRDPHHDGVRTVTFEEWCAPGEERETVSARARDSMARLLASQVRESIRCPSHLQLPREPWPRGLWPVPHNSLFDFERTSAGAEWIDDRARACRSILDDMDQSSIPAHMDWSLQHVRFGSDDSVAVVYDWDSLRLVQEARALGSAAATFTLRNGPHPTGTPGPDEARAFVAAYESARGAPFTREQWRGVSAAALYAASYGARCEHALGLSGAEGRCSQRLAEIVGAQYFRV